MFSERTSDYLAYYRPAGSVDNWENEPIDGIYFNAERVIDLICRLDLEDSEILTDAVAVHELFHTHTDITNNFELHIHRGEKPPWCRLKEAAANRASLDWLMQQSESDDRSKIEKALHINHKAVITPGYGEYELLNSHIAKHVPSLIQGSDTGHIIPPEYKNEIIKRRLRRSKKESLDGQNWVSLLRSWGEDVVPFYINWLYKG